MANIEIECGEYFDVICGSDITIYGGGKKGISIKKRLEQLGCNIKCFIDCRGSEIHEIEGIPVYEPIGETVDIIKDTVLIIAVEDGMQHAEIARLFKAVKKILFLPIGLNCSMEKKYLYREAYYILENSSEPILKIPIFEEGGTKTDRLIIRNKVDKIVLWYPVNKLYVPSEQIIREQNKLRGRNIEYALKWANCPIDEHGAYKELFKYLKTGEGNVELYMKFQGIDSLNLTFLENRKKLYQEYKFALKYDLDFFIQSPAKVVWNGERLYLVDGSHRVHFLISEGYDRVPISVSVEDYDKMRNRDYI